MSLLERCADTALPCRDGSTPDQNRSSKSSFTPETDPSRAKHETYHQLLTLSRSKRTQTMFPTEIWERVFLGDRKSGNEGSRAGIEKYSMIEFSKKLLGMIQRRPSFLPKRFSLHSLGRSLIIQQHQGRGRPWERGQCPLCAGIEKILVRKNAQLVRKGRQGGSTISILLWVKGFVKVGKAGDLGGKVGGISSVEARKGDSRNKSPGGAPEETQPPIPLTSLRFPNKLPRHDESAGS